MEPSKVARDLKNLKIAIVHDWFVGGGAEKVVQQISQMFPEAPIYTAYCSERWRKRLAPAKVHTSYMQNWPFSKLRKFLPPLRQHWFSHLDLSEYDLVISSSGAEAKGIRVPEGTLHVNYCHAPTHYYWSRYDDYLANPGFGKFNWLARFGLKLLLGPMRQWDYKAAQRPNYIIANSNFIKKQIKKYYGRDAEVIHPPIDIAYFAGTSHTRAGYVIAGRQTPYKRTDLAVAACTKLGLPLRVIGRGPDHNRLVKMAGPSVTFLTKTGDPELAEHLQSALGFIFPSLDDFGIAAVESLAAGTPVIAYKDGGALDYVTNKTGVFFEKQTVDSLVQALENFKPESYDRQAIVKAAQEFSPEHFQKQLQEFLEKVTS